MEATPPDTPADEPSRPRRGRPPYRSKAEHEMYLDAIAAQWEQYHPLRNWADVYPTEVDEMEARLCELIDECRERRIPWRLIGQAMGGQVASGALTWWQRRNAIVPKRRQKK